MSLILITTIALALIAFWPVGVLSANRDVAHYVDQELRDFKVKTATHIYKGAFVGLDASTGYARPLVAGDPFLGIAYEEVDNSAGASGAKTVQCYTKGDFELTLSGAALTDIGDAIYASADDTLTQTSSSNSLVGYMVDLVSANKIILRLKVLS